MELFFNDHEISSFLDHYSAAQWIPMLKIFIQYSLRLFKVNNINQYPSLTEIEYFFNKMYNEKNVIEKFSNLYKNIRDENKRIRDFSISNELKRPQSTDKYRKTELSVSYTNNADINSQIELNGSLMRRPFNSNKYRRTLSITKLPIHSSTLDKDELSNILNMTRIEDKYDMHNNYNENISYMEKNYYDSLLIDESKVNRTSLKIELNDPYHGVCRNGNSIHDSHILSSNDKYEDWISGIKPESINTKDPFSKLPLNRTNYRERIGMRKYEDYNHRNHYNNRHKCYGY